MARTATVCAFRTTTHATTTASALETIRVVAGSRDEQASAIDALDDGGHVQREYTDPRENLKETEDSAQAERRDGDDAGEEHVGEQRRHLGDHQHDAVLRVPLHLRILLLDQQRDD